MFQLLKLMGANLCFGYISPFLKEWGIALRCMNLTVPYEYRVGAIRVSLAFVGCEIVWMRARDYISM